MLEPSEWGDIGDWPVLALVRSSPVGWTHCLSQRYNQSLTLSCQDISDLEIEEGLLLMTVLCEFWIKIFNVHSESYIDYQYQSQLFSNHSFWIVFRKFSFLGFLSIVISLSLLPSMCLKIEVLYFSKYSILMWLLFLAECILFKGKQISHLLKSK